MAAVPTVACRGAKDCNGGGGRVQHRVDTTSNGRSWGCVNDGNVSLFSSPCAKAVTWDLGVGVPGCVHCI